jgi:hypothetical protein
MLRSVALTIAALIVVPRPAHTMPTPQSNDGLRVWITRGGSYCIREIAVFGKVRCQSEAAWAKEGVTFTRSSAASRPIAMSTASPKQ